MPTWLQLSFKAPPEALDTVSNFLIERGSPGVVIEKNGVRAFFPLAEARGNLRRDIQNFHRALGHIYPSLNGQPLRWAPLKDRNWNNSWRRFFAPIEVGRSLWIAPPWVRRSPPPGRQAITVEPGMAFGTGTHFTTRTCLEFIERVAASLAPRRWIALDLGTGSGILAIALAKLKAQKVLALDLDPLAVKTARDNVRRNRVSDFVTVRRAGLESVSGSFDVVAANLTAETLIALAQRLARAVAPGGSLIVSGILRPKTKSVLGKFPDMRLAHQKADREWSTLLLQKET
ncbi:MAG TPA: 50S ribosomal protein L11 methyltransferase [Candidatus Acidoferrales bacterium]|nr:50S ribosomal protein L11 methyltransferase [Candidatus Acidoferrales bacterium]